jgi:hypothetical protein
MNVNKQMYRYADVDFFWDYETARAAAGPALSVYRNTYVRYEIRTGTLVEKEIYTFTDIAVYLLVNEFNRVACICDDGESNLHWRLYVTSSKVVE